MAGKLERITLGDVKEIAGDKPTIHLGTATFQERLFNFETIKLTIGDKVLVVPVDLRHQSPATMQQFLEVVDSYLKGSRQYLARTSEMGTMCLDRKYVKGTLYKQE